MPEGEGGNGGAGGTGTGGAGGADADATAAAEAERLAAEQAAANKETRTAEELAAELKRVNGESAERRKKLEALEAAEAERKKGELGEVEALKVTVTEKDGKIAELQGQLAQRDLKDDVTEVATTLGFRNPAIAHRLIDLADVTDDEGKVDKAKVTTALKEQLKANDYLGGARGSDGGARTAGGNNGGKTDMNAAIRRGAGRQA